MKLRHFILIGCTISTVGCSPIKNYLDNRENLYLKSHESAPLKVPAGLSSSNVGQDYVIPAAAGQKATQPPALLPPDSLADEIAQGKVSKSALKQREKEATKNPNPPQSMNSTNHPSESLVSSSINGTNLQLNQPLPEAWSTIGTTLTQAGYRILVQNPNTKTYYVLDTKAKLTKETPIYQIHLHKNRLGTQVSITDNNGAEVPAEVAQPILNNISGKLANNIATPIITNNSQPVISQNNPQPQNFATNSTPISFVRGSSLEIKQQLKQTWAMLNNVLPQAGYKVLVQNPETKTFYIVDTQKKVTRDTPIYQLHLRNSEMGTQIFVTDNNDQPVAMDTAQPILNNINNKILNPTTTVANKGPVSATTVANGEKSNFGDLVRWFKH